MDTQSSGSTPQEGASRQRQTNPAGDSLDEAFAALLRPLAVRLADIEHRLIQTGASKAGEADNSAEARRPPITADSSDVAAEGGAAACHDGIGEQIGSLRDAMTEMQKGLESRLDEIFRCVQPPEPADDAPDNEEPDQAEPAGEKQWELSLLGEQLCKSTVIEEQRHELLKESLAGDRAAKSLLAQIMLTQGASAEQFPMLLKEVGEAYYRWHPKMHSEPTPWEIALTTWLNELIEAHGLRNTIELAQVGDRFDPSRHTAAERGVEVAVVRGWIVLRENGKALHKALVSVR